MIIPADIFGGMADIPDFFFFFVRGMGGGGGGVWLIYCIFFFLRVNTRR